MVRRPDFYDTPEEDYSHVLIWVWFTSNEANPVISVILNAELRVEKCIIKKGDRLFFNTIV